MPIQIKQPKVSNAKRLTSLCSILSLCLFLNSCGAPTLEAKVANALVAILTNTIIGYAMKDSDSTNVEIPCGDGSEADGSFSYDVPESLTDPLQLIMNPDAAAALVVTFNKCAIDSCGERVILDGGTATLGMGITASELVQGAVPAAFTLSVENQEATGLINQEITYSYKIEAPFISGSQASLSDITIKDSEPAKPLIINGISLNGENLLDIADGC